MEHSDSLNRELMALEQRYWTAIKDRDAAAAAALSHDPCLVVGAQGAAELDKATLEQMLQGAGYELKAFALTNFRVRQATDDVAIVAYKVREELVVDGKDLTLEAFDSSVWMRRGQGWVCVAHTESLAGDPFGRR